MTLRWRLFPKYATLIIALVGGWGQKRFTIEIIAHSGARRSINGWLAVTVAVLVTVLPLTAGASPPALTLPLACAPNRDCWIANHVDLDPGPGVRDYACGDLTYDGHKGTDFAIRDRAANGELVIPIGVERHAPGGIAHDRLRQRDGHRLVLIHRFLSARAGRVMKEAHPDIRRAVRLNEGLRPKLPAGHAHRHLRRGRPPGPYAAVPTPRRRIRLS